MAARETGSVEAFSDGNLIWRSMVRGDLLEREVSEAHVAKISRWREARRT
jgi:hypothetical protein